MWVQGSQMRPNLDIWFDTIPIGSGLKVVGCQDMKQGTGSVNQRCLKKLSTSV